MFGSFGTPTGQLVSDFSDRDDLIEALMTSCHIPLWMDGRLTSSFRGSMHMDGGVTNFIPLPPEDGTPGVRITCFGAKQMGLVYDIGIAPDIFDEWPHSLPTMVQWAYVSNAVDLCRLRPVGEQLTLLDDMLTHVRSFVRSSDSIRPRNTFKGCWSIEGSRMPCLGRRNLRPGGRARTPCQGRRSISMHPSPGTLSFFHLIKTCIPVELVILFRFPSLSQPQTSRSAEESDAASTAPAKLNPAEAAIAATNSPSTSISMSIPPSIRASHPSVVGSILYSSPS